MKRVIYIFGALCAVALLLMPSAPVEAQIFGLVQTITVVDSGTACVTAPTACASFQLDNNTPGITLSVSGTWTGTLTFEGTNNDGVYTSVIATNLATGAQAATTTASGLFSISNPGLIKVRARATASITGGAIVTAARGMASKGGGAAVGLANTWTALQTFSAGISVTSGSLAEAAAGQILWTSRAVLKSPADGAMSINNNGETIGSRLKADALPTVNTGFGTSPAITTGSTPLAGSVNVGTGGVATSGVIDFGGTAFPSAPFCVATTTTTNAVTRVATSATQLTLNSTTAWAASDVVFWMCISSRV